MRRLVRLAFFSVAGLLWLVILALLAVVGLEAYTAHRLGTVEKTNAYVLAYNGYQRWPDLDAEGKPVAAEPAVTDSAIDEAAATGADLREDHLGTRFAQYPEQDRQVYAELNEQIIAVYDREGRNLGVYGTPERAAQLGLPEPSALANRPLADTPLAAGSEDALSAIRQTFETGKPTATAFNAQQQSNEALLEFTGYPMKNQAGDVEAVVCTLRNITGLTLTEAKAREVEVDDNPMWLVSWVEYRKDAKLSPKWHTNNVGFRDDDVVLPKPPEVFRIACVGGSTTEEGFTNETTYPNIMEAKLNAHFAGAPPVEVINCGVVGLDSLGERRRALDFVRLEPDIIVEYNGVNDICHALFPMWQKEWERDAVWWQKVLRQSRFLTCHFDEIFWPNDEVMIEQLNRSTIPNLRTLAELAKERGVTMAICSFAGPDIDNLTDEERDYYEWNVKNYWQGRFFTFKTYCRLLDLYNEAVHALCKELDIIYIPVAEELKGGTVFFGDICHMRPKGIDRKAEIMAEHLQEYIEP